MERIEFDYPSAKRKKRAPRIIAAQRASERSAGGSVINKSRVTVTVLPLHRASIVDCIDGVQTARAGPGLIAEPGPKFRRRSRRHEFRRQKRSCIWIDTKQTGRIGNRILIDQRITMFG